MRYKEKRGKVPTVAHEQDQEAASSSKSEDDGVLEKSAKKDATEAQPSTTVKQLDG